VVLVCCLWGLSLLLSFVFFLTLRSISRCLKKIDRSIDRSKECCDVVGSKTKKQNIHLFFFFCVCVCVAQTPPQPQPLYYFLPKTAKFYKRRLIRRRLIRRRSRGDESERYRARERERKSSGIKCGWRRVGARL
jgi:hypothetical protein